ncbi:MAG: hypothetical protein ACREH4_15875 [Vitreimonas sp.]
MKPFALLSALIAVACAATLFLAPAQAQQSGAVQTQNDESRREGKPRSYVSGNFAGDLGGQRSGLVPNVEAQQPAPTATLPAGVAPDTARVQPPSTAANVAPPRQSGAPDNLGVRYRMFLPNGEPVRANPSDKQKTDPNRQGARQANEEAAGEDDDD